VASEAQAHWDFTALHHPFQNCTFAEMLDLFKASSEFQEVLRVALHGGIPRNGTDFALGNRDA
jgi:hypothetical protein